MKNIARQHLVIDARWCGPQHTGIGRYTQNLLRHLKNQIDFDRFKVTLIINPEEEDNLRLDLGNQFNYFITKIRHYTVQDQIITPINLYLLHPNLVHFTHLDKPILYFGKSLITVHDLIKHYSTGLDTTTQAPLFYWIKHLAYLFNSYFSLHFNNLIVPSRYWYSLLVDHYHLNPKKITITPEAVDPNLTKLTKSRQTETPMPYILYTGNLYPHKNLTVVLKALKLLPSIKLKIISKPSVFLNRLKDEVAEKSLSRQVDFLGYISDSDFGNYYQQALAFVFPSLMEGFGLPPLEAMALSCPVISSNKSCMPEIYGKAALYFDPSDPNDLATQIKSLLSSPNLRHRLINLGHSQVKMYSWTNTAKLTYQLYQRLLL